MQQNRSRVGNALFVLTDGRPPYPKSKLFVANIYQIGVRAKRLIQSAFYTNSSSLAK